MSAEFNVQLYDVLGTGRKSPNYSQTIVNKGRVKESIDFVAAKNVDLLRQEEVYHSVQIMGKFKHDNIVRFVNWYVTNTRLYVILEYCPGGNLLDLLERDVCLPESVIRIFCSDVLSALHYIHNRGFIFHDLTPRNILLDECGVIKLNDFARATQIDEPFDLTKIDKEILEYLPPEMLVTDSISSFASDFYALACLMYRMATGATPFYSENAEDMKKMILNSNPQKITECSADFNDLVLRCLNKDPYKRPTWKEVVRHPFWQNCLTERLDDEFKNFNEKLLPPQPIWESSKGITPQGDIDLSKSLLLSMVSSTSELSSKSVSKGKKADASITKSGRSIIQSINKSTNQNTNQSVNQSVNQSTNKSLLQSVNKSINKSVADSINNMSLSYSLKNQEASNAYTGPTINDLMKESPLFAPATVVLNTNIESFPLSSTEGVSLPVTTVMLKSKPEEAIQKIDVSLKGSDPVLSFLIEQSKSADIANNLANSSIFPELVNLAKTTKHPSLAAGFLLLYGTILKFATDINDRFLTTDSINTLQVLSCSAQEKISRKAISVLGQLATYIINGIIKISMPSFMMSTILKALRSPDEPIRHYALRTVANMLAYGYDVDQSSLENILTSFDFGQSQYLTETFAITISLFYTKYTAASNDFAVSIVKNLISRPSPTLQTLALIIASTQNLTSIIKDGILNCFKSSTGELRVKSFLSMCLLFTSIPAEFIDYSQKFFHMLEKMATEAPDVFECVMKWSVEYCELIVGIVLETQNIDLLMIVYNAMQIRQISTRIWTPRFEKKIERAIRNHTFNTAKSEVAIQIVQCALCYQLCDVSIVADMCRAINSQQPTVRFAVTKLIADASMQRPLHSSVMTFIENNILTQILPLLQDEDCIVDQTLRILANASAENPEILKQISAKQSVVVLIFNSVCDNQAALQLSTQLIASNEISIDCMVNTRFIPALIGSLDKRENSASAIELLFAALTTIEKKKNRRTFIKAIHNLATVAPKLASLILEYPRAGDCLCLITRIFTPQGNQNEVIIESAFNPFATALSSGYTRPECATVLAEVIKTFTWAVENSPPTRLKLKGATRLMTIMKKSAEGGTEEIKQAASACLKAVK